MRKLINNPKNIVDELIEGYALANNKIVKKLDNLTITIRRDAPIEGKVAILTGGGSGHEPLFEEYVGKGMADAAAHGQIFASPSSAIIYEAIKAVNGGSGVLMVYCNYAGDILNFNMAQEMAEDEGILIDQVRINDDISSGSKNDRTTRRGTTATPLVLKIAGAASEAGLSFEEVKRITQKAIDFSRSLGVSLSACTLPETGLATFTLEEGKMEFGMGLHGEAGIKKVDLMSADDTAQTILDLLIDDLPFKEKDDVVVLINSYGSTTKMELYIIARKVHYYLSEKKIGVYSTEIGEFCTSQEMAGVSITLMKIDNELKKYFDMPCRAPGFKKF